MTKPLHIIAAVVTTSALFAPAALATDVRSDVRSDVRTVPKVDVRVDVRSDVRVVPHVDVRVDVRSDVRRSSQRFHRGY